MGYGYGTGPAGRPLFKMTELKQKKSLTLVAAIAIALTSQAQLFLGVGAGGSTAPSAAADLQIGYNIRGFLFQGGYVTHINRKDPAIFNARVGHEFYLNDALSISFSAGYAYQLYSTDNKYRNLTSYILSADISKYVGESGALVFTLYNSDKYVLGTIGFRHYFTK